MKFKNYIETESGIKDTSTSPGTAGQVLSSTVTGTSWIDPDTLVSAASKLVVIACKNVSGTPILKGTPVYQSGTVGATDVIEVEPADAIISTGYLPAIGILQTTLNNNGLGNVVITGEFLNYSTADIPTDRPGGDPFTGDTVYLAAGGGLTCIKPTGAGNAIQNVGLIGKVSGGNAGSITVASIMRANDVPNLPTGKIWVGDGNTIVSDVVYLDETNERMGIGTVTPQEKLHIYSTGAGPVRAEIESTQATDAILKYTNSNRSYATFLTQSGQFSIYDYNAASHRFYMLANGNIGINTTTPSSKLHSVTTAAGPVPYTSRAAILGVNDSTDTLYANSVGVAGQVRTSGGYAIYGDAYGAGGWAGYFDGKGYFSNNVGIGTTSPNDKLVVQGDGDGILVRSNDFTLSRIIPRGQTSTNWDKALFSLYNAAAENVRIDTAGSSWFNGGNVGIGTTSPSQKLHVVGAGYFQNGSLSIGTTSNVLFNYISSFIMVAGSGQIISLGGGPGNINNNVYIGNGDLFVPNGDVGIGTTNPSSKLQVNGGVQLANDTASPSALKVGTFRYRTSGNNSYVDMCMQVGTSSYAWVNIVTNNW